MAFKPVPNPSSKTDTDLALLLLTKKSNPELTYTKSDSNIAPAVEW